MSTSGGPLRADAQRNRDQVVAAAQALFAERGIDTPMEEIGRAAGVGKGTLYRNFPSRDHLYAAISVERFARLRERASELSVVPDPWEALVTWLGEYDESAHHYRGLSARVSESLAADDSAIARACHPMRDEAELLLRRAQESGDVVADLSIVQLLTMVGGLPDDLRRPEGGSELLPIVLRGIGARQH